MFFFSTISRRRFFFEIIIFCFFRKKRTPKPNARNVRRDLGTENHRSREPGRPPLPAPAPPAALLRAGAAAGAAAISQGAGIDAFGIGRMLAVDDVEVPSASQPLLLLLLLGEAAEPSALRDAGERRPTKAAADGALAQHRRRRRRRRRASRGRGVGNGGRDWTAAAAAAASPLASDRSRSRGRRTRRRLSASVVFSQIHRASLKEEEEDRSLQKRRENKKICI